LELSRFIDENRFSSRESLRRKVGTIPFSSEHLLIPKAEEHPIVSFEKVYDCSVAN
jgi:hypothetical protein